MFNHTDMQRIRKDFNLGNNSLGKLYQTSEEKQETMKTLHGHVREDVNLANRYTYSLRNITYNSNAYPHVNVCDSTRYLLHASAPSTVTKIYSKMFK